MKIIRHGKIYNEEGIIINCSCGCEFCIENKDDWIIKKLIDTTCFPYKKCVEYNYKCPECGGKESFGLNPNECGGNLISPYKYIFDRKDWKERYSAI